MTVRKLCVLVCASLVLVAVGLIPVSAEAQRSRALPACDPDNGGLILPEGFCALVVADGLEGARHLDVTADGDIYVHLRGSRGREPNPPGGGVVALRDADGDGRAEVVQRFSDHYGTGLQLRGDYLYVSTTTEVYRYRMTPGELVPRGEPELIVSGFPEQRGHAAKAFAFDESDNLYVNVGAPSNVCMENRGPGSPGQEPCLQRVRQASVWRFDADRTGQTQESDGHQFVTGTRNIVAIAWDPATRAIYAAQHGRDAVHTLWPDHYNEDCECRAAVRGAVPADRRRRFRLAVLLPRPVPRQEGARAGIRGRRTRGGPVCGRGAAARRVSGALGAERPAVLRRRAVSGTLSRRRLRGVSRLLEPRPARAGRVSGRVRAPGGRRVHGALRDVRGRVRGHLPLAVSSGRGPASRRDRPGTPAGRSTSPPTWGGRCGGLCTEGCRHCGRAGEPPTASAREHS